MNKEEILKYSFSSPANYEIRVQGELSNESLDRLGELVLVVIKKKPDTPVSILTGRIADQSALSGILNELYDMHLMVLSVNIKKK